MTDWKAFFQNIAAEWQEEIHFFDPATEDELQSVRDTLGVPIPDSLAELLRQTNGVSGEIFVLPYLVGSCEDIIRVNQEHEKWFREYDVIPPGQHFLFGEDGCGNSFGFAVENGLVSSGEVRAYCPIENEFKLVAGDLKEWATKLFSNTLRY